MSKIVTVRCTWYSYHNIEVPDDFRDTGHLSDYPEEALEEMTPDMADLVDWEVR